jgi:hypothetical protein
MNLHTLDFFAQSSERRHQMITCVSFEIRLVQFVELVDNESIHFRV